MRKKPPIDEPRQKARAQELLRQAGKVLSGREVLAVQRTLAEEALGYVGESALRRWKAELEAVPAVQEEPVCTPQARGPTAKEKRRATRSRIKEPPASPKMEELRGLVTQGLDIEELRGLVCQALRHQGGPSHPAQARALARLDRESCTPARSTPFLLWLFHLQDLPPGSRKLAERELRRAYDEAASS